MGSAVPPDKIKARAASAVIVNGKNQILLLMRDDFPVWVNIGGALDAGESFEQALRREIMEETGLKVRILREGGDYFSALSAPPEAYLQEKLYFCVPENPGDIARLGNDGIRLEWFDIDKLPHNIPPGYRLRIEETLQGRPASSLACLALPKMKEFSAMLRPEQIYGFAFWKAHPKVQQKQAKAAPSRSPRSCAWRIRMGF